MGIIKVAVVSLALVTGTSEVLWANYLICLKNNRCIAATSYSDQGKNVWFSNSLGKISIPKDQVESITKSGISEAPPLPDSEVAGNGTAKMSSERAATEIKGNAGGEQMPPAGEKALTPEQRLAERKAGEEQEYQKRVRETTEQIKVLTVRYSLGKTGGTGAGICITGCENFIEAKTADLKSRLKDGLYDPARARGSEVLRMATPSPFAGTPPTTIEFRPSTVKSPGMVRTPLPTYTPQERELSDLRKKIGQLSDKREGLIREMQGKGFDTGSLFLE